MERMIMSTFFGRKHGLPEIVDWMHNQYHKLIYAEDVLTINAANRDFSEIVVGKLIILEELVVVVIIVVVVVVLVV